MTDATFSTRIVALNESIRQGISRRAKETLFSQLKQELQEIVSDLRGSVTSFKFLQETEILGEKRGNWKPVGTNLQNLINLVKDSMQKGGRLNLEAIDGLKNILDQLLYPLHSLMLKEFSDYSESVGTRLEGLRIFKDLMDQTEVKSLEGLETQAPPERLITIRDLYKQTGENLDDLTANVRRWKGFENTLSSLEKRLSEARIKEELRLSDASMSLLKSLLKGSSVQLGEADEQALLDLRRSPKLRRRISLVFGGSSD